MLSESRKALFTADRLLSPVRDRLLLTGQRMKTKKGKREGEKERTVV